MTGFVGGVLLPSLRWWLVLLVIGWAAVPIAYRLLRVLPDRGLAFARPLGLLLVGYAFWIGGLAGVVPNSASGVWAVILALVALGGWVARPVVDELRDFLRAKRQLVLGYEALVLIALVGWALYRAYYPDIVPSGGEKYMEMAFINAILESPQFPPNDPWMAGFSISYYYLGYLIAAFLTRATALAPEVAFNLQIPMALALTLAASAGLGYNLVALAGGDRVWRAAGAASTAVLTAVVGSLEGALELVYLRGWLPVGVFQRLNVIDLNAAHMEPAAGIDPAALCDGSPAFYDVGGWLPTRHIWWWRGSRVVHDGCAYTIHEFPFFSFMLGDVHPHVVALPYVLTVLALALAVLAGALDAGDDTSSDDPPLASPRWLALPLVVGALGFLNTWDLPTYAFVLVAAYALRAFARPPRRVAGDARDRLLLVVGLVGLLLVGLRLAPSLLAVLPGVPPEQQPFVSQLALALALASVGGGAVYALWGPTREGDANATRLLDVARFTTWLGALSLALYLPFYIGFRSQASGLGVVERHAQLGHVLVHFGLLLFAGLTLVALHLPGVRRRGGWTTLGMVLAGAGVAVAVVGLSRQAATPVLLGLGFGAAALVTVQLWARPPQRERESGDGASSRPASSDPAPSDPASPSGRSSASSGPVSFAATARPVAPTFALLCVAVGVLLPLGTEFVFIRDIFGNRMNTVFKLYYQAWTLMAIGGAFAPYAVRRHLPRPAALGWGVVAGVLVLASLYYPVAATYSRTNRLQPSVTVSTADGGQQNVLTLDGLAYWARRHPEDVAAVEWLEANAHGNPPRILEAAGGGYQHTYRISTATGFPTVLGSDLHEWQWRGTREDVDPRKADVERIYTTTDRREFDRLIEQYGVRYVVVGSPERAEYGLGQADVQRFRRWLRPVHEQGNLEIFEVP